MDALQKSQQIWDEGNRRRGKGQVSAHDGISKGEYMFDETEKAAHAMAVMLEKFKKQFGFRGYSNVQLPDSSHGASEDRSITQQGTAIPFHGVLFNTYDCNGSPGRIR